MKFIKYLEITSYTHTLLLTDICTSSSNNNNCQCDLGHWVIHQQYSTRDTYNRILTQIIVCSTSNCIQMHQIFKIADLSLNPFLRITVNKTLYKHRLLQTATVRFISLRFTRHCPMQKVTPKLSYYRGPLDLPRGNQSHKCSKQKFIFVSPYHHQHQKCNFN